MANKGPAYGLSREVQSKIDKKYDPDLEERLVEWIVAQCGSGVGRPEAGKLGFQAWLKDGCVSDPMTITYNMLSLCQTLLQDTCCLSSLRVIPDYIKAITRNSYDRHSLLRVSIRSVFSSLISKAQYSSLSLVRHSIPPLIGKL